MNRIFIAIIIGSLSFVSLADEVTVYRWVDDNGVVHYGQHEPLTEDFSQIVVETRYSPVQAPLKNGTVTNKSDEEDALANQLVKNSNIKCKNARANLKTLNDFDKVEVNDKDGKARLLTNSERLQRLRLSEKEIELYCEQTN